MLRHSALKTYSHVTSRDHYAARWQECGFNHSVKRCKEF